MSAGSCGREPVWEVSGRSLFAEAVGEAGRSAGASFYSAVLHLSPEPSPHGWGTCLEKSHLECEEQTGHTLTGVKETHSSHLLGKVPQRGLAGKVHKQVV